MTTQDVTTFSHGQNNAQAAAAELNAVPDTPRKTSRWKTITVGGVAGIVMDMAASTAYNAFAANGEESPEGVETQETGNAAETSADAAVTEVHQAAVDQNLSFAEAFSAARAEVGPGGVFLWHGQLFNTYTAEEWQSMSDAQRDAFADDVQPFLGQQTAQVHHATGYTETVSTETSHTATTHQDSEAQPATHTEDVAAEPEVHFLGVETREVDGQTINVGHMTVDQVNVALVDVDNDQVFDVRVVDANNNNQVDEGDDFADVSDRGLTVGEFQMLSDLEQTETNDGQLEQAVNVQEDLAPDMPDYMNDADVDII